MLHCNIKNIEFYTNTEFTNELDDCYEEYNLMGCDSVSFIRLVPICQTTRRHIPENSF
jgi:hypothetical protein